MEILEILQRPFPVANIFLPILSVASSIATSIPKSFAVTAAIKPAAPPPTINNS
ncbi:unknown [Clostridium sp. CAG:221]|nr:unknown [Clostridium sp. CAG:221]